MIWINKFNIALLVSLLPLTNNASQEQKYLDFFEKFVSLGNSFNIAVAEMYADNGVVHVNQISSNGVDISRKLSGAKTKATIISLMDVSRKRDAKSEYSNISITVKGNTAKIKASRYSTLFCFHDKNYQILIKKNSDDTLQIIEEFVSSPALTLCKHKKRDQVKLLIEATVIVTNQTLPLMADPKTRLEKTSSEGDILYFHYTLITLASHQINPEKFQEVMRPNLIKQTCTLPSFNHLVKTGVKFMHVYYGKDKKEISTISVFTSDCEGLKNN